MGNGHSATGSSPVCHSCLICRTIPYGGINYPVIGSYAGEKITGILTDVGGALITSKITRMTLTDVVNKFKSSTEGIANRDDQCTYSTVMNYVYQISDHCTMHA